MVDQTLMETCKNEMYENYDCLTHAFSKYLHELKLSSTVSTVDIQKTVDIWKA